MTDERKQEEKKEKSSREVFEETTGNIEAYNTGTQKVIKSAGGTGGSVVEAVKAVKNVASDTLESAWGKKPITEINDLKKQNEVPDDIDYRLFLCLNFLKVTREKGEKIKLRYGKHKFEGSSIKGLISRIHFFTSTFTSDYMNNMQKPDVGDNSISPETKAKLTVEFMKCDQEMAAVLWIMNLRESSLFDFTPAFSRYYQKAREEGRLVAGSETDEFSYLLKGKGAVYELVKEEEEIRKTQSDAKKEISKKRVDYEKARLLKAQEVQSKKDLEPLAREMIDLETREKSYKAAKEEELSNEQKARQKDHSTDTNKVLAR